ncbi:serine hydrolase [Lewinella sp. W8]|uniref:serine hydrolase n=1 Tax=Lewinella sp. W8 TaxID=2528208 RepID=UPI001068B7E5|nr:serine hydrolase [Lewinella sp. W8]MTB53550.1 serine hydrolase [Lewinella sp. W8]
MPRIITLMIALLTQSICLAQTGDTIIQGSEGRKLDAVLTPYLLKLRSLTNNDAALAVGVTRGDQILYARTFGYANIERSLPANLSTVFHIASVSKPFTAAALVKLVEQGKLELDDLFVQHVPEFEMKDERYRQITLRQMLNHTSGIPRHVSVGDWDNPVYGRDALDVNLKNIRPMVLDFAPGSEFSYSNSAFDLLGIVVSRAGGGSFGEFVQENILLPSGMKDSGYAKPRGDLPSHWAVPYSYGLTTQKWSPYPYSENYFPSSGLHTTLRDMCHWGMLLANKGRYGGEQVIGADYFSLLTTPTAETPWGDRVSLSWFVKSYLDRPIIMHQGNDTGFEALMYVYPEDSISVVVMANRDFSRTARIINAVSECLFEQRAKTYTVSAKYPFTDAYREGGMARAASRWAQLKRDTTDIYVVEDDAILTTGAVLENGKNWTATREILEYYLTLNDQSTYAWRLLGNAYLHLGQREKAKSCYETTLRINPDYAAGKKALEALLQRKE